MNSDDCIPNSPYFTDKLTSYPEELSLLRAISKPKRYAPGEVIYMQGEEAKPYFYLVEDGRVKISLLNKEGSEKIIIIHEKNTIFGYAAAIDGHPCFQTATAMEETTLGVIHVGEFRNLIEKHPKVSLMIIGIFARVTRTLCLQLEDISFLDAQRRVAHMICKLAYEVGQKTDRGIKIVKKVTQEDIASLTGLSRVSVSLALNEFEELDILRKKRNTIEIFDIKKLERLVGDLWGN